MASGMPESTDHGNGLADGDSEDALRALGRPAHPRRRSASTGDWQAADHRELVLAAPSRSPRFPGRTGRRRPGGGEEWECIRAARLRAALVGGRTEVERGGSGQSRIRCKAPVNREAYSPAAERLSLHREKYCPPGLTPGSCGPNLLRPTSGEP